MFYLHQLAWSMHIAHISDVQLTVQVILSLAAALTGRPVTGGVEGCADGVAHSAATPVTPSPLRTPIPGAEPAAQLLGE